MDESNRTLRPRNAGFTLLEMLVVIGIIVLLASLVLAVSGSVIRASEERSTRNTLELLNAATEEYERTQDRGISYRTGAIPGVLAAENAPAGQTWSWDVWSSQPNSSGNAQERPPLGPGNQQVQWTGLAAPYSATTGPGLPAYSTLPFRRTAQLVWLLTQTSASASIMQKIPESSFRNVRPSGTGVQTTYLRHAVDAWDTPIVAVFPGREANINGFNDPANNIDADGTVKCDSEWATPPNGGMLVSCKNRKILWVSAGNDSRFTTQTGSVFSPSTDNLYSYEP